MDDIDAAEILLVEDSEDDAEMTMRALRKHNFGNKLTWVKDGAEALDFLFCAGGYSRRQTGNPKLVLLDVKMPKMDGIEVLKHLKANDKTKSIPVVILTSSAECTDVTESYKLGVNSYLVKPVDFDAFMNVVAQVGLYWTVTNKAPN
ncbi:response regulator [Undibacterium pigrum]|uniref:Two-component system response regulator n=1 Tax=Undibacterium pigrum TaxID=401470 RepID=A0A318J656_9BURK|nr:response regulator [Undibacterium pigrum]PXX42091.1 two-component system response regulator [Undibacterium pigrum]